MIHGHAHGLPYYRIAASNLWLPESLPGLLLLVRGERTDLMTFGTQPASIVNPGFDSDTGWTKGSGWTISGGYANCTATSDTDLSQSSTLVNGHHYSLDVDVASIGGGGTMQVVLNSAVIGTISAPGYQTVLGATNGNTVRLRGNAGVTVSVDRVANFANRSITQVYGCAGSFTSPLVQDLSAGYTPYGFDGVIGCTQNDFLRSVTVPETWNPMHQNQDWYLFAVLSCRQTASYSGLFSSRDNTAYRTGCSVTAHKTNNTLSVVVANGSANVYSVTAPSNSLPADTKRLLVVRHTSGSPANLRVYVDSPTAVASANAGASFNTTTDAQGIAVLGQNPLGLLNPWVGSAWLFGVGAGTITNNDLDRLGQYCRDTYGTAWS